MPRQKESYNLYPPLTVANVHLEKSFCVKYLGVYIDCHLTWHDHIDYICGKISKNINIMVKLKHYVSKATLISVYYSLIYPYLTYPTGTLPPRIPRSTPRDLTLTNPFI